MNRQRGLAMPSLYIPSLFEKRKQKYGERIARARQELADYLAAFEAEVGNEVAAVLRAYAAIPAKYFPHDEEHTAEQNVFGVVRQLIRQKATLLQKLRSPECFYRERSKPPYVLWCYGVSWEDIKLVVEDGHLPLEHVLRLRDVLRNGTPTREVIGQERVFRRRRLWLVRLLRTAAFLEEDVVCRFPSRTTMDLSEWLNGQLDAEEETQ
jgi:hypothetical protein